MPADYAEQPWQQQAGPTAFAPFPADTSYFGKPHIAWMITLRVRSLEAMAAQLRAAAIAGRDRSERYPNGRFGRLHDPDGNPIELWEPAGTYA